MEVFIFMSLFNNPDLNDLKKRGEDVVVEVLHDALYYHLGNENNNKEKEIELAKNGNVYAQRRLANLYYYGEGVEKDLRKAIEWYILAAKQGDVYAQRKLGNLYYYGEGVEKNLEQAVEWFDKAAEQGDAVSQTMLGHCYFFSIGVNKDINKALTWIIKAAEQNNVYAQRILGHCYFYGIGVGKDFDKAFVWIKKAAEQNDKRAQHMLDLYSNYYEGAETDLKKAFSLIENSAQQGNFYAYFLLGYCYYSGEGVKKNKNEAFKWIKKAAEQGDGFASSFLIEHYFGEDNKNNIEKIDEKKELASLQDDTKIKSRKDKLDKSLLLINSIDDLTNFIEDSCENISKFKKQDVSFNPELLTLRIKIKGGVYDGTITTPVMKYILSIQNGIYKIYKHYNNGRLTEKDKKQLEITVKVDKGCSDIIISFKEMIETFKTAVNKMTGNHIFALIVTAMIMFGILSVVNGTLDNKAKEIQQKTENERLRILSESLENKNDEIFKINQLFLQHMIETLGMVIDFKHDSLSELKGIGDINNLTINEVYISHESIVERLKPEKNIYKDESVDVIGTYLVTELRLNFKNKSARMDLLDVQTGEKHLRVVMQDKSFADGSYQVLKNAQKGDEIKLKLIIKRRNGKNIKIFLDEILM